MKSRLSLIACLLLCGCLDSVFTPPADKTVAPVVKSAVTQQQFFSTFADYMESHPRIDHTQQVYVDCKRSMDELGLSAPSGFEATMAGYIKVNKVLTPELRASIVKDLRGLAK